MNIRNNLKLIGASVALVGGVALTSTPAEAAYPRIPAAAAAVAPAAVEANIPIPSQAELAAMLPATAEQTITDYYCSGPIAVPGTYGTINHCASFAISKDSAGQIVETPASCRLINNTGKNVNWYSEAWTHWDGYIFKKTAYGTTPPGTWTKYCGAALSFWRVQHEGSFVRASVQAAGSTQTAGANVTAP
jgi:hypothetical protein